MKFKTPSYITVPLYLFIIIFSFYVFTGGNFSIIKNEIVLSILSFSLMLLLVLELLNKSIYNQKLKFLSKEDRYKIIKKNKENYFFRLYKSAFYESIDETKKIKKIDHNFDGILELDNKLPSWWVNLFYISIVFSILYFLAYIFTDFANTKKEYEISYREQIDEVSAYEKLRPQATIETSTFKEDYVQEGKVLFEQICATCHNIDGSGNTGPNLTDSYWINVLKKDLFKNIFYIIWNGSKNNPIMRGFGVTGELKGNDIEKIASYIYLINTNPKKPIKSKIKQGEKIIWENFK